MDQPTRVTGIPGVNPDRDQYHPGAGRRSDRDHGGEARGTVRRGPVRPGAHRPHHGVRSGPPRRRAHRHPSAGRGSPSTVAARTPPWPGPASRPPRSSPDTSHKPARSTSSAPPTTCRPCCPAITPTGCGDPAAPPTAPCSRFTCSASCGRTSPAAPAHHPRRPVPREQRPDDLQIGVCTGPAPDHTTSTGPHASWPMLWPHLKHYG